MVQLLHGTEFQKKSLPLAHILIILKENGKLVFLYVFDKIVYAEIPDKNENPHLQ